jgi:hypothetical protein
MHCRAVFALFISSLCISGCITSSSSLKRKTVVQHSRQPITTAMVKEKRATSQINYTFLDTINRENELLLTDSDFKKDIAQTQSVLSNNALPESLYRIQVFASNRIETVREQKKELEKNTDEPLFIDYDAPYYKLYAGGFSKRQEAQSTLLKLKRIGYTDAWIVSMKINP